MAELWLRLTGLRALGVALASLVCLAAMAVPPGSAATYHVALAGNDVNPGTEDQPWRTLEHAVDELAAGDTLLVHGGIYRDDQPTVRGRGTASAPITIRSIADEQVTLDGSFPELQAAGNDEWDLVDGARDLYRSKRTYPDGDWTGKVEHNGKLYALNLYDDLAALAAPGSTFDSSGTYYMGPGFLWNSSDQKIYIRLTAADPAAIYGRTFAIPADPDPRRNRLFLSNAFSGIRFSGAEYVIVDGIDIKYFHRPLYFVSGHDLTVKNGVAVLGRSGAVLEDGIRNVALEALTFDAGFPAWISWRDVKSSPRPAASLKLSGLLLRSDVHGVRVAHCRFIDVFDGITAVSGQTNLEIVHNEFNKVIDDALQLGSATSQVEYAYNISFGPGPAHDGSGNSLAPGTKHIHHNIIDVRQEELYGRVGQSSTGWRHHLAMPSHGVASSESDPWKLYNNTILFADNTNNEGAGQDRVGARSGPPHEVYNNIFMQFSDWRLARGERVDDGGELFDANLYFRAVADATDYFFAKWENGGSTEDFGSLAEFLASPFFLLTQSYYPAGWESSGVEADPGFRNLDGGDYRPASNGPAAGGALDLSGKGWPGATAAAFRGAVDPAAATGRGQVGPQIATSDPEPPPPEPTPVSAPTDLQATAVSEQQVDLAWTAATGDVVGYRVYRDDGLIGSPTATAYSDTGLSPGTSYSYAVSALDAAGTESDRSSSVSVTTPEPDAPPPSPGGLVGLGTVETYRDSARGSSGGTASFASDGGDGAAVVAIFELLAQSQSGLERVSGVTFGGQPMTEAAFTGPVAAGLEEPALAIWFLTNPPVGDSELAWTLEGATDAQNVTLVNLAGVDPSDPVGAVAMARQYDTDVLSLPVTLSTTVDGSLLLGGSAIGGPVPLQPGPDVVELASGETGNSQTADLGYFAGWADALVVGDHAFGAEAAEAAHMATAAIELKAVGDANDDTDDPPSIPAEVTATVVSDTAVDLAWTAATDDVGVAGYRVYRDGSPVGAPTDTTYADTGLSPGTSYGYAVSAVDTAGNESGKSDEITVTTSGDATPPEPPQDLAATAASPTQVNLKWTAATDDVGVTGYQLYRDDSPVASPAGTAYSDTGLSPGTSYSYAVSALDAAGNESDRSGSVSVTTPDADTEPPPSAGPVEVGAVESYRDSRIGSAGGAARLPSEGGVDAALVVVFELLAQSQSGLERVGEVTFGGQPMTEAAFTGPVASGLAEPAVSIWFLTNPPVGDHELAWTLDGRTDAQNVTLVNLTGVDPSDPVGAMATARQYDGGVLSLPVTVSTTADGSLLLGGTAANLPRAFPFQPGGEVLELASGKTGNSSSKDLAFFAGWSDTMVVRDYAFEAEAAAAAAMATAAIELKPNAVAAD